jgi:Tfp pilus assembly protein PilZ
MLTSIPFRVGDDIRIVFNYGDQGNPIRLVGKVARVTPEGVGVRFISLNHNRRAAILSLVSKPGDARRRG